MRKPSRRINVVSSPCHRVTVSCFPPHSGRIPFPLTATPIRLWRWPAANAVPINDIDNSRRFSAVTFPFLFVSESRFGPLPSARMGRETPREPGRFAAGRDRLDTAFPRRRPGSAASQTGSELGVMAGIGKLPSRSLQSRREFFTLADISTTAYSKARGPG